MQSSARNTHKESANNMADVTLMVVLSIQQNWLSVGDQLADVRQNKADSRFLWGNKGKTYAYLAANKHRMYDEAMTVINSSLCDGDKAEALMDIFLQVDGLGLPKAGFMCQLMAGLVGCMDSHNIKMYGIDPKSLSIAKKPKTQKKVLTLTSKRQGLTLTCAMLMGQKRFGIVGANYCLLKAKDGLTAIMFRKYTTLILQENKLITCYN